MRVDLCVRGDVPAATNHVTVCPTLWICNRLMWPRTRLHSMNIFFAQIYGLIEPIIEMEHLLYSASFPLGTGFKFMIKRQKVKIAKHSNLLTFKPNSSLFRRHTLAEPIHTAATQIFADLPRVHRVTSTTRFHRLRFYGIRDFVHCSTRRALRRGLLEHLRVDGGLHE